jgi:ribose/xylose/arabinose/galactoside ABC-type transport system permease subunit
MSVYLISALLATFAGLLLTSRFEAATATFGTSYELQAISAAVIGVQPSEADQAQYLAHF